MNLVDLFGPLASMHAALDDAGLGQPCATTARFRSCKIGDVERAVAATALCFPVLQRRLIWCGSHPTLVVADAKLPIARAGEPLLSFSPSAHGALWRLRLTQDGPDVRLDAVWAHAVADGLSMLAFVQMTAARLRQVRPTGVTLKTPPRLRRQPFGAWLPRFLIEQHRSYRRIAASYSAPVGASWLRTSRQDADRILETASRCKAGFAAWLATAALGGLRDQQGWQGGSALLNVPIGRHRAAATNGFGFGIGSLILPVPLDRVSDVPATAAWISGRLRRMAHVQWDDNFERLIGRDPRRHRAFARIERRRQHPMITVSWKGRHTLGNGLEAHDVACFAASPAAHISAHADEDGLSISLTSHQPASERHATLSALADRLDCSVTNPIQDLD